MGIKRHLYIQGEPILQDLFLDSYENLQLSDAAGCGRPMKFILKTGGGELSKSMGRAMNSSKCESLLAF